MLVILGLGALLFRVLGFEWLFRVGDFWGWVIMVLALCDLWIWCLGGFG